MISTLNGQAVTGEVVRDLASHVGSPAVSSLYLDIDGAHRPVRAQVQTAFEQLADSLVSLGAASGDRLLTRAVESDVERMRDWLGSGWDRSQVRGLALFAASREGWFEVVSLAHPVVDTVRLASRPKIRPLVAALDRHPPVVVALIDRRRLRIFQSDGGRPVELPPLTDLEPRAVDTDVELGGFGHQHEEAARGHYRRAAERVGEALRAGPADEWVVGGPDEAVSGLDSSLRPSVRRRLVDRLTVRVAAANAEIEEAVRSAQNSVRLRREAEAIRTLIGGGSGQAVSTGLEATLAALGDRRVGTLLVADGFVAAGSICSQCGALGSEIRRCLRCGAVSVAADDIVELAIDEAVVQKAAVEFVAGGGIDQFGRIAAIDRF